MPTIRDFLREMLPNIVWDLVKCLLGPTVLGATLWFSQKIRGIPPDWGAMVVVFVVSLALFVYATERGHRFHTEGYGGKSGLVAQGGRWRWVVILLVVGVGGFVLRGALQTGVLVAPTNPDEGVTALREALLPRRLTQQQIEQMANRLRIRSGVSYKVLYSERAEDGPEYARQFYEILKKVWGEGGSFEKTDSGVQRPEGVLVQVMEGGDISSPPLKRLVMDAFREADVKQVHFTDDIGDWGQWQVMVLVGAKPYLDELVSSDAPPEQKSVSLEQPPQGKSIPGSLPQIEPAPPRGYIFTEDQLVRLRWEFLGITRPCVIKITAPPENMAFRQSLVDLISSVQVRFLQAWDQEPSGEIIEACQVRADAKDFNPELYPDQLSYAPPGIIVVNTTEKDSTISGFIAYRLTDIAKLKARTGTTLPPGSPEHLIYIQIGTGPLRD